ncbi:MAG: hypothetical protein K2X66_07780 [Cyanobacteria bacterium]|jgi:hypothetical protein|nr:hypothetical protein [Cyanobacteriota bacterium]
MKCDYCQSTKVIKTGDGYKCRDSQCEGSKLEMKAGVVCEQCGDKMEFRGLNSYGEPSYKCTSCGISVKL